jgi:hypothetical protein
VFVHSTAFSEAGDHKGDPASVRSGKDSLSEEGLHDEFWHSYEKTSQRDIWSASARSSSATAQGRKTAYSPSLRDARDNTFSGHLDMTNISYAYIPVFEN